MSIYFFTRVEVMPRLQVHTVETLEACTHEVPNLITLLYLHDTIMSDEMLSTHLVMSAKQSDKFLF